jgi:hypothetical protein
MSLLALKLVTPPASEPITLLDAKSWLHLDPDFTDDDAIVTGLIQAARERVEDYTGRSLVQQQWRFSLDWFPSYHPHDTAPAHSGGYYGVGTWWWDTQCIYLPRAPLISVDSFKYQAVDGTTQTLPTSGYILDSDSEPARILPAYNAYWPTALQVPNAIQITYTAGYQNIPQTFLLAMRLAITAWYENPSDFYIGAGAVTSLPLGTQRLLQAHRISPFDFSVR